MPCVSRKSTLNLSPVASPVLQIGSLPSHSDWEVAAAPLSKPASDEYIRLTVPQPFVSFSGETFQPLSRHVPLRDPDVNTAYLAERRGEKVGRVGKNYPGGPLLTVLDRFITRSKFKCVEVAGNDSWTSCSPSLSQL